MKTILLCLHGWGGSKESFTELRAALGNDRFEILTPDLPGFGAEPEPNRPWTTDDYADWVTTYIQTNVKPEQLKEGILLLGHSHGGRIAIKLAARLNPATSNQPFDSAQDRQPATFPIDHLYLCAAAGIKRPRHIKRIIGLTLAKAGKFLLTIPGLRRLEPIGKKLLYKLVRVHDYEKASPVMRQTMINVTQEDLRPLLPQINIPTDLFWGTDDGMTPIADAYVMHEGIKDSHLHVYKGVRHGVHREKAKDIAEVISAAGM